MTWLVNDLLKFEIKYFKYANSFCRKKIVYLLLYYRFSHKKLSTKANRVLNNLACIYITN